MARAGFCTRCKSNVWLTGEGTCPYGHEAIDIRDVYETEAETQRREQFNEIAQNVSGSIATAPATTTTTAVSEFAPCPNCGSTSGEKVGWTIWGGILGPKMFNHTKCLGCGAKYNGKTGKSNTMPIAIYVGVTSIVAFVAIYYLTSSL